MNRIIAIMLFSGVVLSWPAPSRSHDRWPDDSLERRIAVTVDDLPWATLGDAAPPQLDQFHTRLVEAMKTSGVPVTGFVNEGKLVSADKVDTHRVHLLRDWTRAGFDLGNHTFSHMDRHAVDFEDYASDILRGETFLRPLLEETGRQPGWFRHPYLRTGRTPAEKGQLQAFLDRHGYRIAPVTIDNSDWIWAGAYRKALAANDQPSLLRLRTDYVPYMLSKIDYFEGQSIQLLGYNLPHVLLIHANELNADTFGELKKAIGGRGYSFVTLEQAMTDPAYQRKDTYTGRYGPSWIHRWAIAEKRHEDFFAGDPRTPAWVLEMAGVASE